VIISRVIAHRGSSAAHLDNSWAAFHAAVADGADVLECDVQSTLDGILVIRHDLALQGRLVCELTSSALETAEPGTIEFVDFLDWAESETIGLLVEVKDPDAMQAVAMLVAANLASGRIVVGSFHAPALAAVKATLPAVQTSLMIGSVMAADEIASVATASRVDGVHLCWEARAPRPHRLLEPALIERLRRNGLTITLWHEERPEELRALVALEPDAICTNTPAVLRRIVDAHRARDARPMGALT
jgi:glycerophosphoryl diester phosphodiesterase